MTYFKFLGFIPFLSATLLAGNLPVAKQDPLYNTSKAGLLIAKIGSTFSEVMTAGRDWQLAATADFDNDHIADLVWQNADTGQRVIYLMSYVGIKSTVWLPTLGVEWAIVGAGDFDGDGHPDLVWQNEQTGERVIWAMVGTTYTQSYYLPTITPDWDIVGVVDIDGDTHCDLLWKNRSSGALVAWCMNGTNFSHAIQYGAFPDLVILQAGDFDGDGHLDLAVVPWYGGFITGWTLVDGIKTAEFPTNMDSTYPYFRSGTSRRPTDGMLMVKRGDFDRDDNADVILRDPTTGQVQTANLAEGVLLQNFNTVGYVPSGWVIGAIEDFNLDGYTDIVWQNLTTGQRVIWLCKHGKYSSTVDLGTIPVSWHIVGAADYNMDGKADLYWQNEATGEYGVWLMNGTTFSSYTSLGTESTDWLLVLVDPSSSTIPGFVWRNRVTGQTMRETFIGSNSYISTMPSAPVDWELVQVAGFSRTYTNAYFLLWQNKNTGACVGWDGSELWNWSAMNAYPLSGVPAGNHLGGR